MSRPVGLYSWGGPGTIRLLRAKYRAPRIDEDSFLRLYEPSSLAAARERLGVTDMWVTYSWGFSDATEEPDRRFLRDRLPGFRDQGIRTHAYVQGLNVVTDEFAGRDIFCRDGNGRLLPYSRGRSLTCPNNPEARRIILDRVRAASREDVDGVFVDNIVFGIPPLLVRRDFISFAPAGSAARSSRPGTVTRCPPPPRRGHRRSPTTSTSGGAASRPSWRRRPRSAARAGRASA